MDPVSLVVAALIAGAAAGGKAAAGEAAKDAYKRLKGALGEGFSHRKSAESAIGALERQAEQREPQEIDHDVAAAIRSELVKSGAPENAEVRAAATDLLRLVQQDQGLTSPWAIEVDRVQGMQVGDFNTQTNTFGGD